MIPGYWVLNKDKRAVKAASVEEWGLFFRSPERIVKQETIGDVKISTVFLGLDHQFGDGPPLLFETMIFGGKHDEFCDRCTTWGEAEIMHQQALLKVEEDDG